MKHYVRKRAGIFPVYSVNSKFGSALKKFALVFKLLGGLCNLNELCSPWQKSCYGKLFMTDPQSVLSIAELFTERQLV